MKTVRLYNKHEDYESKKNSEVYINKYCLSYCMDQKDCHVYDKTIVTMDWLAENTNGGITKQVDEDGNTITYTFKENLIDELDVFKEYTISDFDDKYINKNADDNGQINVFVFNKKSISQEFANHIVDLVNNNELPFFSDNYYKYNIPEFKGELNVRNRQIPKEDYIVFSLDDAFNGSNFTSISILTEDKVYLGSLNRAFIGAGQLQNIDIKTKSGYYPLPYNPNAGVSGAFEFCGSLRKLPKLRYGNFRNCGYTFEWCGVEELPKFYDDDDTIRFEGFGRQFFNCTHSLKSIYPILDLQITDETADDSFTNFIDCDNLTSVKLKGLYKWNFDFTKMGVMKIPKMDAESALYAINNALDVTELGGLSMNFPATANQNGELNAVVDSAKAKGWTIKVDGQEIQQS